MKDLELLSTLAQTDAALAAALKVIAEHVKALTTELAAQKAQIDSLAFIQRAGRHA